MPGRFSRRLAACAAALLAQASPCAMAAPAAQAADRSAGARLFGDFCLAQEPSLTELQARARTLGGAIAVDHTVPHGGQRQEHFQAWLVRRGNSIYQISADEGDMAVKGRRAVACGVTAPDTDGADLARTMSTELGLGAPFRRVPPIGGSGSSVFWHKRFGTQEATIRLAYGAQAQPGSTIHLILANVPVQAGK